MQHRTRNEIIVESSSTFVQIELLYGMVTATLLHDLLPELNGEQVYIFKLAKRLTPSSKLPVDCTSEKVLFLKITGNCLPFSFLSQGATTDSKMLFPAFADYVLATGESTFGFPGTA